MKNLYQYTESGLDNVWLDGGVVRRKSPYGGTVAIQDVDGLHEAIGRLLCEKPDRLSGKEFRFLRTELDLSRKGFAGLVDMTDKAVEKWESGDEVKNGPADRLIRQLYLESIGDRSKLGDLVRHLAEVDRRFHEFVLSKKSDAWVLERAA